MNYVNPKPFSLFSYIITKNLSALERRDVVAGQDLLSLSQDPYSEAMYFCRISNSSAGRL